MEVKTTKAVGEVELRVQLSDSFSLRSNGPNTVDILFTVETGEQK